MGRQATPARVSIALLVVNLLLGVALLAMRSPARRPATEAATPSLPPQVERLRGRIDAGHRGEAYSLTLSDAELTQTAAYFLASAPDVPFDRVRVAAEADNRVRVEAVTRGLAVTVPVAATTAIGSRDGTPWVRVEAVSLAGVPVPTFVREQVLRDANRSLDLARYPLSVTVDVVESRPGALTLRGSIK